MLRSFIPLLCLTLLSCSSSPSKSPAAATAPGVESLLPVTAGAKAIGGTLEVVSVTPGGDASIVVLRATSGTVQAFVHPRWFGDASLKREFRAAGDDWLAVRVEAGKDLRVRVPMPYPFAGTLGLDVAKSKPATLMGEGRALPGRLVVTPEQAKQLAFYQYPDLKLTQYESKKHTGAPKLAVWRNGSGKVVAAVEIYVRADAKPAKDGLSFLHTNGKPAIGTSLAYSNSKKGGPAEDGWEFVVFQQGDREVAVPWKPLVKNASFLGACMTGVSGLDATQLGDTAQIGTFAESGAADMETVQVESPSWSMANPTGGSLSTGAPVQCEYSGANAQRWSIETGPEMTITGSGGGGGNSCTGTLPSGSGSTQIGTLRASRPGKHQFLYASEDLHEDPTSEDRLTTSDGPVCPGEEPAASTEIVSDAGKPCSSDVPGCTSNPIGEFVELVIPCASSIGTTIRVVKQKDEEPGFVAVACDGEETDDDMGFTAVPFDEENYSHTWYEIDDRALCAPADGCVCEPCKLIIIIGEVWKPWPSTPERDTLVGQLADGLSEDFDFPGPANGRRDPVKKARHDALLKGGKTWTEGGRNGGWGVLDRAIAAARTYGEAMAAAGGPHVHVLKYDKLDPNGSPATRVHFDGDKRVEQRGCETRLKKGASSLGEYFENCHQWSDVIVIYHGVDSAFDSIATELMKLLKTPVRKIVFWSCWGGDLISKDAPKFQQLAAHLQQAKCNCPPRNPGGAAKRSCAGHPPGACTACPDDQHDCRYKGTTIITASNIDIPRRSKKGKDLGTVSVSVPLGIDYVPDARNPATAGQWVLNSADGQVRTYVVPEVGPVTGPATGAPTNPADGTPAPVFGDTPLGTDASLRATGIERNMDRIMKGVPEADRPTVREGIPR